MITLEYAPPQLGGNNNNFFIDITNYYPCIVYLTINNISIIIKDSDQEEWERLCLCVLYEEKDCTIEFSDDVVLTYKNESDVLTFEIKSMNLKFSKEIAQKERMSFLRFSNNLQN